MTAAPLSPSLVVYLSALTYSCDAAQQVCLIPLSGLYWEDEIPDFSDFIKLREEDRVQLLRLFAIRYKLWDGAELNTEERQFLDASRLQVPHSPIFQRLELSAADKQAHKDARHECNEEVEALLADFDQVTLAEHGSGVQTFSAKLDLTKDQPQASQDKSWWKEWFSRKRESGTSE